MTCPNCGATNYGSTFCMRCRKRLSGEPSSQAPPVPTPRQKGAPGRNPAQTAALASLIAPAVVWFLGVAFRSIDQRPVEAAILGIVHLSLTAIVLLVGIVSSVVALVLVGRYGRDGVLGRAVLGLIVCTLSAVVLVTAALTGLRRGQERKQLDAEMKSAQKSIDQLLEKAAAGEALPGQGVAAVGRIGAALRKSAQTLDEPDRSIMLSLADVSDSAASLLRAKEGVVRPFLDAGGLEVKSLGGVAGVEQRLGLARAALAGVDVHESGMKRLPIELAEKLRSRGVPDARGSEALQRYSASLDLAVASQIARTDREFLQAAVGMLELLAANAGRWRVEPDSGTIVFDDTATMNRYNALVRAAQAAGEEQTRIQKEALVKRRAAK